MATIEIDDGMKARSSQYRAVLNGEKADLQNKITKATGQIVAWTDRIALIDAELSAISTIPEPDPVE